MGQTSSASRCCFIAARPCDASMRTVPGLTPSMRPASSELNPISSVRTNAARWRGASSTNAPATTDRSSAVANSSSRSSTETVLRSASSHPAVPLAEQVHGGPVEVADRLLHVGHAVPSLPDLQERVLSELLRLRSVARDQAEMRVQVLGLTPEEVLEGRRLVRHDGFARARVGGDRRIVHHARFNPWRGRIA